jgi:hypothetical protein
LYRKTKSFSKELKNVVVKIKLISVNLPESYLKVLEILSEAIRVGIRDLIRTEYLIEESVRSRFSQNLIETEIESEI